MSRSVSRHSRLAALAFACLLFGLCRTPAWASDPVAETYGGRQLLVYVPSHPLPAGSRALVVVLHGGLGNADRIAGRTSESGLNLDAVAETNGFIVAYLNGTPVTRFMGGRFLGWNAGGGCCGQPAQNNVDDVAYIKGAVEHLISRYGIDPGRVYGMGHSNGAMMTQRLLCETDLYAAGIAISGPLNLETSTCPAAKGRRILAIHGAEDQNVPIKGGRGAKGLSGATYASEDRSRLVFTNSGAGYTLDIVAGADHKLEDIDAALLKTEGVSLADKAIQFFGLARGQP